MSLSVEERVSLLWKELKSEYGFDKSQIEQFKVYSDMIQDWSGRVNLTAIFTPTGIIKRHFQDSLEVSKILPIKDMNLVVDIGSGAGLPGIPLKIQYPDLKVILMEVNRKKKQFLEAVIEELGLKDIEVCETDFRAFIRTTEASVDLFVSRACLGLIELTRLFKPGCSYKNSKLAYWGSKEFEVNPKAENLIKDIHTYKNANKTRKLVILGL